MNGTFHPRHLGASLAQLAGCFKVVLLTGARQVGKSTLLHHVFPQYERVEFDPVQDLHRAREDPDFFLDQHPPPLILDEIQFAPELLPAIKRRVDRRKEPGQYILTGSQDLGVLRSVSESLAGRVGIVDLHPMSLPELDGRGGEPSRLAALLFSDDPAPPRRPSPVPSRRLLDVLWRGGLPGLLGRPDRVVSVFHRSYLQTYVERDVRLAGDIRESAVFSRFLGLLGALSGQEINDSQIGRDVGVAPATARRWLALLAATFQWFELSAWHGNTVKRVSSRRKGYLADSGLACHLQRISSLEALAVSPLLGPVFEGWVVGNILRQCQTLPTPPQAWHWRSNGGAEIDLVLERDGQLTPIEIKCKSHLTGRDGRGLRAFADTYGEKVRPGFVVYAGDACVRLGPQVLAVPWFL